MRAMGGVIKAEWNHRNVQARPNWQPSKLATVLRAESTSLHQLIGLFYYDPCSFWTTTTNVMSNDRRKTTASVSHFTGHNGRPASGPLLYCLPALTSFLYRQQSGRKRSSWRTAAGGVKVEEEDEGGEGRGGWGELFLCGPSGRAVMEKMHWSSWGNYKVWWQGNNYRTSSAAVAAAAVVSLWTF